MKTLLNTQISVMTAALAVAFALLPSLAMADAKEFSFNGLRWNFSPAQVEKAQTAKPDKKERTEEDQYLLYQSRFADLDVAIDYNFKKEKLATINLMFHALHKNPQDYITEYDQVTKAIEARYGAARSRTVYDKDGKPLETASGLAEKIGKGEASIVTLWELPDTSIMQNITGDESLYAHDVSFLNKKHLGKTLSQQGAAASSSPNNHTDTGK